MNAKNKKGIRTVALVLALIMLAAILIPIIANAEEVSKEQILFNKLHSGFGEFLELDTEEVAIILSSEWFAESVYALIMKELAKNEELSEALIAEDGELKEEIVKLFSENNVAILLEELKSGEANESLVFIKTFIENVEVLFGENWEASISFGSFDTAVTFSDIQTHWAKDYIEAMAAAEIVNGYTDGTFNPNGLITRAEFAKIIVLGLELELVEYAGSFSDVAETSWYASFVATMVDAELTTGYTDGTFKPNNQITRAEMAAFLSRTIEGTLTEEEIIEALEVYEDVDKIPTWAREAVAKVTIAELMQGSNGMFNPNGNATRAEATTVIYRIIN